MDLQQIPRPPGALIGVPQRLMPPGRQAHEEAEIVGERCVLDWFWSPVRLCVAIRVVQMQSGAVLWFSPNL